MKRKTSTTPTRIWSFGCLKPDGQNLALLNEQLKLSNEYYNALIDIELNNKFKYNEMRLSLSIELQQHEFDLKQVVSEIENIRFEIKKANQIAREKVELGINQKQRIKDLKDKKKIIFNLIKNEKAKIKNDKNYEIFLKKLTDEKKLKNKEAQHQFAHDGLYWGTYLLVEKSVEAAINESFKNNTRLHKKRFFNEGRVGVALRKEPAGSLIKSKRKTGEVLNGESKYLKIERLQFTNLGKRTNANLENKRKQDSKLSKNKTYSVVKLRVGTDKTSTPNKPIFVELKFVMHRPLPSGIITGAWVKISKIGTETKYSLQLSIESEEFETQKENNGEIVAIDLGWRKKDNGDMRVGYYYDESGKHDELILSREFLDRIQHVQDLRSISDKNFDSAKSALTLYIKNNNCPGWLKEKTQSIGNWRSSKKLAYLSADIVTDAFSNRDDIINIWEKWKIERGFDGNKPVKQDLFDYFNIIYDWVKGNFKYNDYECLAIYLEFWRRKNRHLYQWESNEREKALASRKDFYRKLALKFAKYDSIVLEDMNLSGKISIKTNPEEEKNLDHTHLNRVLAAPSEFRNILKDCIGEFRIKKVNPFNTSKIHFECGQINNQEGELKLHCKYCNLLYDRDLNASKNILKLYTDTINASGSVLSKMPSPLAEADLSSYVEFIDVEAYSEIEIMALEMGPLATQTVSD